MNRRITTLVMAASLVLGAWRSSAREWRSSDGSRTMQAKFVSLRGDQLTLAPATGAARSFAASAFSAADQKFATTAQAVADAAVKWGPQSFEVSQIVDGGCLCRLALPPSPGVKGPALFSGEMFFLTGEEAGTAAPGAKLTSRLLFGAGGRTFHPLKGGPAAIRAFALDAGEAAQTWLDTVGSGSTDPAVQSPIVSEPEIEVVTTRGIGIAIARTGLFVIDAAMAKDASSLLVFLDGDGKPASVVKTDEKLGLAVVSCELAAEPPRIGMKKASEIGQRVYAVSFELNANKRGMAKTPVVTLGVVSRFGDAKQTTFEHDAKISPESIGGYVVGMRGEVAGFFFRSQSTTRAPGARKTKAVAEQPPVFAESVSTQALGTFVDGISGVPALRTSPVETDVAVVGKELMKGTALVVAMHEVRKVRETVVAKTSVKTKAASPAGTAPPSAPDAAHPPPNATGWSLSKSGTRHNSKCRFYDAKLPCAVTDGKACKVCGG